MGKAKFRSLRFRNNVGARPSRQACHYYRSLWLQGGSLIIQYIPASSACSVVQPGRQPGHKHRRTRRGVRGHAPPQKKEKMSLPRARMLLSRTNVDLSVYRYTTGLAVFCSDKIVHFVGAWTGNHRSVWFIFGSESSSPCRFLGITHSFKVIRKRLKCLENAFPAIISFKIFWGRAPWASCLRRSRVPPAAARRTSTKSCWESMPVPPPNLFHPVRLWA